MQRGAASRSYGIAGAKLAGLPESVLASARTMLATLERNEAPGGVAKARADAKNQLDLFGRRSQEDPAERDVLATIKNLDLDRLTGIEALNLLHGFKDQL